MTCPKASQHTEYAHVELGDEAWAHLKRKLTHSEAQQIEVAQLAANYQPQGSTDGAYWLIHSALTGAPEEWRNGHKDADGTTYEGQFEPTMRLVKYALSQYETDHETAMLAPDVRARWARARVDLYETYARTFFATGSWGDSYPPADAMHAEIIEDQARRFWNEWNEELGARLKALRVDSSGTSATLSSTTPAS